MHRYRDKITWIILFSLVISMLPFPLQMSGVKADDTITLPNGSIAILPEGITQSTNVKGYGINLDAMMKDRILVFGTNDKTFLNSINPRSVDRPNAKNNYEYRYVGYDLNGSLHTNPNFPPDVDSPKMPWERDIVYRPWEKGLLGPGIDSNNSYITNPKESEDLIKKILHKYNFPSKGMSEKELIKYYLERYYIQALPSPGLTGSVRQFHRLANGEIWYQTLTYEQPIQIIEKHSVKADFDLKDKVYEYQNVGYKDNSTAENSHITYRRLTIAGDGYFAKVENNKSPDIRLKKGTYTFTLDVENNIGDKDTCSKTIEVIAQETESGEIVAGPPIAIVIAPETAVINEAFKVSAKASMASAGAKIIEYKWYIGDSPTSLQYVAEYDNLDEIGVSYPTRGTKYFQVKIKDTKNAEAVSNIASTNIIDDTPTSVTAKVDVPDTVYEGVFFYVSTLGSKVMYGDENLSVKMAVERNIARYGYNLSCPHTGSLEPKGGDIYVEELGEQTIKYKVRTRDAKDEDVDTFTVLPTPQTQFYVSGVRKENRRLVIDTTGTIHHVKYPIDHDKTVIKIKDIQTGEIAVVKKASNTNRTNIKTTRLTDDGIAEWTAKRPGNYDIEVTTFDTRGKSSTLVETIKVEKDIPPEANIISLDVVYRDTNGKATIKVTKNPVSRDSDHINIERIEYRYDKNNNGSIDDEAFVLLPAGTNTVEVLLNKVGKVEFQYYVRETFDYIPSHVSDSDFLSDIQTKIITVDNIAPITSFDVIKKSKVDILAFADETNFSTAKNKTERLKKDLNSDSNVLVDVIGDTKEFSTSNEIIELVLEKQFYGEELDSILASNEDTFIFRGNSNLHWIKWKDLSETKSIPYNTYDSYKVIEYTSDNMAKQRLFANKGTTLYEIDISTGNVLFSVGYNIWGANSSDLRQLFGSLEYDNDDDTITLNCFCNSDFYFLKIDGENGNIIDSKYAHGFSNLIYIGDVGGNTLFIKKEYPYCDSFEIYKYESNHSLTLLNYVEDSLPKVSGSSPGTATSFFKIYDNKLYLFFGYNYKRGKSKHPSWNEFLYVIDKEGNIINSRVIDQGESTGKNEGIVFNMKDILEINNYGIFITSFDQDQRIDNIFKYDTATLRLDYRIRPLCDSNNSTRIINIGGYNPNGYVAYVFTSTGDKRHYINYLRYRLKDGALVNNKFQYTETGYNETTQFITSFNDPENRFHVAYREPRYPEFVFIDVVKDTINKLTYSDGVSGTLSFLIQIDDHRVYLRNINGQEYIYNFDTNNLQKLNVPNFACEWYLVSPDRKHFALYINFSDRLLLRTYKINKGFMSLLDDLEKYTKRSETNFYIPIITKDSITITENDINKLVNKAKELNGKILFLGSYNNSTIGQRLANSTGGMFATYTTLDDAYNKINTFIKNDVGTKEQNKTIYVKKGEEIFYSKYYADYEGDPVYQLSGERWKYSQDLSYPRPDGIITDNNQWITAPKKFIDKVGRFLVSFIQQDNPPPGNTAYESYRKWSNENPMEIIVYDGERPPEVNIPPKIDIEIAGDLRENHRVDFIITALKGSKDIKWSSLDISFNASDYLPYTKPTTTKFSRVFKNTGEHKITVKICDIDGTQAIKTAVFNISSDRSPGAGFNIRGDGKRNKNGIANFVINNTSKVTDDPIGEIKYFIEDTKYEDDGNGKMLPAGNAFYKLDIPEDGKLDIEKVGQSKIKQVVTDYYVNGTGLNGENLDQYRKFKTAEAVNTLNVNNIPPRIKYMVAPEVILVGEKVSHNSILTDDTPDGDCVRYKFTHNESCFDNSQGKHSQANVITEDPTEILDKKGLYVFYAQAMDEDGATSEWASSCQVKVVSEPVSDFKMEAKPENNSGENRQFEDYFFKKGSVITVQNKSYSEDYTSASNKGIAHYKLEYRDVSDSEWTLVTEQSDLTRYVHETNLPRINDRGIYEIRQTVTTPEGIKAVSTQQFTLLELRMEAELDPDTIYPSQTYKIKATLSQDGQGAVAYIDYVKKWVTLEKVDEDAKNKYYEISIATTEIMPDGQYPITVYGLYPFGNEIKENLVVTVETPFLIKADISPQRDDFDLYAPGIPITEIADIINIEVISPVQPTVSIDMVKQRGSYNTRIGVLNKDNVKEILGDIKKYGDIKYAIPKDAPDGVYNITFTAKFKNGLTKVIVPEGFENIRINTPIDIRPVINSSKSNFEIYIEDTNDIGTLVSKYTNEVSAELLGITHVLEEKNQVKDDKTWNKIVSIGAINEGNYTVRYTARTWNGNVETKTVHAKAVEPLSIIGGSDKDVYRAGQALLLNAETEGKAFKVEARCWWNHNEYTSTNTTTLVPDRALSDPPQKEMTWHSRRDRGDRDIIVIIPMKTADGTYPVKFTAYKRKADGSTKTAEDIIYVNVKGTIYDYSHSEIIGK